MTTIIEADETRAMPSLDYLRECFDLDAGRGILTWKVRPLSHFLSPGYQRMWNELYAGKRAGTTTSKYAQVILGTQTWKTHRIVFYMATGVDPTGSFIDHINRKFQDNRPSNLRLADRSLNSINRDPRKDNKSGYPNVRRHAATGKWQASFKVNKRRFHVGTFETPEAAHHAVVTARQSAMEAIHE